jgi:AcrR family transcriptional regulator
MDLLVRAGHVMSCDDIVNLPVMSLDVITYTRHMGRWQPDASGRLREAALELYVEQGFEQTTVAEIAERAGLTARTYFRYFADKREVLFANSHELHDRMVAAIGAAPPGAAPMDAVAEALDAAAELIGRGHALARKRQAVIVANAELRERELIKMESLAAAMTDALRRRGILDAPARLAAETGIAVFRVAFERWVTERKDRGFQAVVSATLDQLRTITSS